ncbi:hypothetical protein IMZ48_31045 [Candidatus Bathyarchaeota archaeon]|nr:hypothetical protein [Candidatus Bathyarchaeota archaeon]
MAPGPGLGQQGPEQRLDLRRTAERTGPPLPGPASGRSAGAATGPARAKAGIHAARCQVSHPSREALVSSRHPRARRHGQKQNPELRFAGSASGYLQRWLSPSRPLLHDGMREAIPALPAAQGHEVR